MKYPYLYADPGLARAVTGSGITPLLLSELEEGGKYGPKINYGGSGTGIDPLNLAGKDGKGTGLDLVSEDEYGEPNLLFNTDMLPLGIAALEDMNEEELKRRMLQAQKPKPKTEEEPEQDLTGYDDQIMREAMKEKRDGEVEEEEEIKTGKDYGELGFFQKLLKAATENPEATLALGRALLKGEGLGIGLADFAEEKISQDKEEAALEKEAEETLYERKLKEREFQLDVAKAEDLAQYYAQMGYAAVAKTDRPLKEIEFGVKYAQLQRDEQGNILKPGTPEFDAKVVEGMDKYLKDSKDNLMSVLGIGGEDQDAETTGTSAVGNNTIYTDLNK